MLTSVTMFVFSYMCWELQGGILSVSFQGYFVYFLAFSYPLVSLYGVITLY